jgi:hypothetical protein
VATILVELRSLEVAAVRASIVGRRGKPSTLLVAAILFHRGRFLPYKRKVARWFFSIRLTLTSLLG